MDKTEIEYYKKMYFELDKPISTMLLDKSIQKNDLFFYPVKSKDYYIFYHVVECLTVDKNLDPKGISNSHLGYLFSRMENQSDQNRGMYVSQLKTMLELSFNIKDTLYCSKCDYSMSKDEYDYKRMQLSKIKNELEQKVFYHDEFVFCKKCKNKMDEVIIFAYKDKRPIIKIKDVEINKNAFDNFRKLVCFQNMPDYDDTYIDPQLKAELEKRKSMENKNMGTPTYEKQLCCIVASGVSYDLEYLQEMPLRKFILLLRTIDSLLHYEVYKTGEMSGMVTFKEPINHWIYAKEKESVLDDLITSDQAYKPLIDVGAMK